VQSNTQIDQIRFDSLRAQLRSQGFIEAVVVTGSMEPVLPVGGKILIETIPNPMSLKNFDVVAFWDGVKIVCHYVVAQSAFGSGGPKLITKGLRSGFDLPVDASNILGKVRCRIPLLHRLRETFLSKS